jgi:hypothetical protein
MDAVRFDHFAKGLGTVGSRRWVIGGLLGSVLGLSRVGAAGANHKTGHHCTPAAKHACDPGQTCRKVSGAWTCQGTCLGEAGTCVLNADCCGLCCNADNLCDATSCVAD